MKRMLKIQKKKQQLKYKILRIFNRFVRIIYKIKMNK
jgi:hypothetical protein